jgi:hypothetical protein
MATMVLLSQHLPTINLFRSRHHLSFFLLQLYIFMVEDAGKIFATQGKLYDQENYLERIRSDILSHIVPVLSYIDRSRSRQDGYQRRHYQ